MTSKQRVRTAMSGGVPDRVPVIPQICHPHAIRHFDMPFEDTILDCVQHAHRVNELQFECALAYGVDGVRVWTHREPMDVVTIDGVWHGRDRRTGQVRGRVDFNGGGWVVEPEVARFETEEDIERLPVPSSEDILESGHARQVREFVKEAGDRLFVISAPPPFTVQFLALQRGKQQALVDIVERPGFCHTALEKALAIAIESALALAGAGVDGLLLGDTFAGLVGPRYYREFCLPYFRRFVGTLEERLGPSRPLIYMHTCGRASPILELMAETGVDCVEPLDPLGGVSVSDAKARIGGRVALMGGVNTLKLACGALDEVEVDIQRCLREGALGGGYILAAGDMLPTETTPEKVIAMVEAAHSWVY